LGYFKKKDKEDMQSQEVQKETVEDVLQYPFKDIPDRKIRKETCERFGVRAGLSEEDGESIVAYYFPSFNQKGKVTGFSKLDLTKSKEEKGHWTALPRGGVSISNKLFGQNVCEALNRKHNNVIVTEGQIDALSTYQALMDNVKGTKYEGLEPFVCSIPMGTANAVESILHNEDFVKSFDAFTMFFDDDHATVAEAKKGVVKGHEAREAVAGALVGSGVSVMTLCTPDGYKDASDMLQAGKSQELAKLVQFDKKPYSIEKIVKASSVPVEELWKKRPEGIYVPEFPKLMKMLHGFRTGELIVLTAPSNVGKSTITSKFGSAFIKAGEKTAMIFLEETKVETLQRMVAAELKLNYNNYREEPLKYTTKEEITRVYDEINNGDKLVMLDHFGSMEIDTFMEKIKHMHLVEGCRYIIIDHLSMLLSGLESENERKDLDIAMTSLAAFCAANDVCIIAVSHINRTAAEQYKPQKGQEDKAFWVKVSKEMMRGSSSLEQLSWCVLGLEPEILPDRSRGRVRLTCLKNRTFSHMGVADTFTIDPDTWEVIICEDSAFD
jgi:archaellum biogenesis ATPase FlaH